MVQCILYIGNDCCAMGGPCCKGLNPPEGPEWDAAAAGFEPFLEEAFVVCQKNGGCCGADGGEYEV